MNIDKYNRKSMFWTRAFWVATLVIVLLFVAVQYALMSVVSIRRHFNELHKQDDVMLLSADAKVDSSYFRLYKEKVWLETRMQIAKTDSISLSVNLKDSLLQLELKGVVLKTSKIEGFRYDPFFKYLNTGAYHHYFGAQAMGENALSTIEKEPLRVKKAPKDTIEYASQKHAEESVKPEAVHWMMNLDNGIVIKIEGVDVESKADWWKGQQFWFQQDFKQLKKDLRQTVQFKVPQYMPEIELVISEADAKAIYRALPTHPLVCVRF